MEPPIAEPPSTCPTCGKTLRAGQAVCLSCGHVLREVEYRPAPGPLTEEGPEPRTIGEFQIRRILGHGGTGIVCEAYQPSAGRTVALKIMDSDLSLSGSEASRFEREAWIGGRLDHPNLVKVHGQGSEGAWRYIALEMVQGPSLQAMLREAEEETRIEPWPRSRPGLGHVMKMVTLFTEVADALSYVHQQGILHRDVKPGNLLLDQDGSRLLLTDFGEAHPTSPSGSTGGGDLLGTVRYMSPEALHTQMSQIDQRSDVYSLGVSLYEAVTLGFPFEGETETAYCDAAATSEPVPARTRNLAVPKELDAILAKCLERDPFKRYQSAAELATELRLFVSASGQSPNDD